VLRGRIPQNTRGCCDNRGQGDGNAKQNPFGFCYDFAIHPDLIFLT